MIEGEETPPHFYRIFFFKEIIKMTSYSDSDTEKFINPVTCKQNKRHAQCFIKRYAHHANPSIAKQMKNYFILEWLLGDLSNDEMIKTRSNHPPVHWRKSQYAYLVIERLAKLNNYHALPQAPHARGQYMHPILGFPFELNLNFNQQQIDWLNENGWLVEPMDYSIV